MSGWAPPCFSVWAQHVISAHPHECADPGDYVDYNFADEYDVCGDYDEYEEYAFYDDYVVCGESNDFDVLAD